MRFAFHWTSVTVVMLPIDESTECAGFPVHGTE